MNNRPQILFTLADRSQFLGRKSRHGGITPLRVISDITSVGSSVSSEQSLSEESSYSPSANARAIKSDSI